MIFRAVLTLIFMTLPWILNAQFYSVSLKKEQPVAQFHPIAITTTSDSIINGYGNINLTTYKDIIYCKSLPKTEFVTDWVIIKNIKKAVLINNDTLQLFPLSVKTGGIGQGLLNVLLYENDKIRLFETVVPHFENVFFIEIKNHPHSKKQYKFVGLNKEKLFKRTAKKVFNFCSKMVDKIDSGHYTNTYDDLILLVNDYENVCEKTD